MNKKTALRLKKACTDENGVLHEGRYKTLKENWKKVPAPARRPLLEAIFQSIDKKIG